MCSQVQTPLLICRTFLPPAVWRAGGRTFGDSNHIIYSTADITTHRWMLEYNHISVSAAKKELKFRWKPLKYTTEGFLCLAQVSQIFAPAKFSTCTMNCVCWCLARALFHYCAQLTVPQGPPSKLSCKCWFTKCKEGSDVRKRVGQWRQQPQKKTLAILVLTGLQNILIDTVAFYAWFEVLHCSHVF